jgi:hypothetical protein
MATVDERMQLVCIWLTHFQNHSPAFGVVSNVGKPQPHGLLLFIIIHHDFS